MKTFVEQVLSGEQSIYDLYTFINSDYQNHPGSPQEALGLTSAEYQRWGHASVTGMDDFAILAEIIESRRRLLNVNQLKKK
jgi:hypothetical protein